MGEKDECEDCATLEADKGELQKEIDSRDARIAELEDAIDDVWRRANDVR